jgi:hypothetical protein
LGQAADHAAGALVEVFVERDERAGGVVVQPEQAFQGGDQRSPGGALFGGAVGERRRGDEGEPAGDLPASDAGEQALGFDLDAGVDERRGQPFGEVFELVGDLGAGAGGEVEVMDLVDFTDRGSLDTGSDLRLFVAYMFVTGLWRNTPSAVNRVVLLGVCGVGRHVEGGDGHSGVRCRIGVAGVVDG